VKPQELHFAAVPQRFRACPATLTDAHTEAVLPDTLGASARPSCPFGWFHNVRDSLSGGDFALRTLDIASDLPRFHEWQNNARVAKFWNERGTLDQHRAYLERLSGDGHAFAAMGYLNGIASAYLEIYWTQEDRLGQHYDAGSTDRGVHFLIGEEAHVGRGWGGAWMRAISHALFAGAPATQRIYCEPDVRNEKFFNAAARAGFQKIKEFDFPHKRAALIENTRHRFFSDIWCDA